MEKEYLSIKEFATAAGVSQQAIYKQLKGLNNQLNNYVKIVDNRKMLNIQALADIYHVKVERVEQPVEQPFQPDFQPDTHEKSDEVHQNYINDTLLDTLLMQSETLKKELEIKNEQIKSLTERLAESQKLQAQLQQLNGIDKQRILELEAKIAEPDQEPAQASKKWWKFW